MENINGYKLSSDYHRLKELLDKGYIVVCFVDYDFGDGYPPVRDVCKAKRKEHSKVGYGYSFGARGIEYVSWDSWGLKMQNYPTFEGLCEMNNIEFIDIE